MDQSRDPKFKAQSYVKHVERPDLWGVMLVEFTSNAVVWCWSAGTEVPFAEKDLRPITFSEFARFRHPRSLKWMSGKTRGWMAVLIHLFTLILCAGIATTSLSWAPAPLVIVAGYWYWTWRNFKGLTV